MRFAAHRPLAGLLILLSFCMARNGSWAIEPTESSTANGPETRGTSDENIAHALRALLSAQAEAWNRGDLDRFMQDYWKSDELTFSSGGKIQRGWQATMDGYRTRYPDKAQMGQVAFDELDFTSLGPDAQLVLGRWRLTRDSGPIGGRFTLVFRRIEGQWKIIHDHTSRDASLETASEGAAVDPARHGTSRASDQESAVANRGEVQWKKIDDEAIHYATFQSHNQKVVAQGDEIWMTHIRSRNEAYTEQQWRLSRSRDGGRTFVTQQEATEPTNPPVLEIDSAGNIYLIRVDFVTGDAFLDRWLAGGDPTRTTPDSTTRIAGGAAGKYAAQIDEARDRIYFFSHNNTFHRLRLDGTLIDSRTLLAAGPHAILQYPQLSMNESGQLHLAWTTQKHGEYLYWDIHHLVSDDGGETFLTISGEKLELPIIADDTGPAPRISLDDEFTSHTWLSSGLARGNYWHGLYLAQTNPPRQHYVRYDVRTGQRDLDYQPVFRGESIELLGLDGFLVADRLHPRRIYAIGNDHGHLSCLRSDDEGQTWHDYARAEESMSLYSIGGFRMTTDRGSIIGSFTDQEPPVAITDRKSRVYFFRIVPESAK